MGVEYINLFDNAKQRTEEFAFNVPKSALITTNQNILTKDKLLVIADTFSSVFKNWSNSDFVGKCLKSHIVFQPYLEKAISVPVTYTVGYIKGKSQNFFEFSEADANNWISNGISKNKVKLHSWLSLPSGEIIDLTFLLTFAKFNEIDAQKGHFIADYPKKLHGIEYVPMFLGVEFLKKIGALKIDFIF